MPRSVPRPGFRALVRPLRRAVSQLDDPAFLSVVLRSMGVSAVLFVLLALGVGWGVQSILPFLSTHAHGWVVTVLSGALGSAVAILAALWLFVPLVLVVATLLMEIIARAVERRYYPDDPPAQPASLRAQIWDGLVLGARVLALNVFTLALTFLVPGPGWIIGGLVAAWALGRGLFVAVAMRRCTRAGALEMYRHHRGLVLMQGGILALASTVPIVNLLVPVLGTAVMVHVVHECETHHGRVLGPSTSFSV